MGKPHEPDCVMYRTKRLRPLRPHIIWAKAKRIKTLQNRGWILLIDEREVRQADIDDTREQDERRRR